MLLIHRRSTRSTSLRLVNFVYIWEFHGSPAISVNLKQDLEHREKVALLGADLYVLVSNIY